MNRAQHEEDDISDVCGTGKGCPERAKDVASEGRATRGTEAGADISGWRQPDAMEAGSKEVVDFAIRQNLRLF